MIKTIVSCSCTGGKEGESQCLWDKFEEMLKESSKI